MKRERYYSKEASKKLKLKWLYQDYKVNEKEFHAFIKKYSTPNGNYNWNPSIKEIESIYEKLVKDNPIVKEIKIVKKYRYDLYFNLWAGMISKFNVDDIKYFLKYPRYLNKPEKNMINQCKLEAQLNVDFQWILSPKTIYKLTRHYAANK